MTLCDTYHWECFFIIQHDVSELQLCSYSECISDCCFVLLHVQVPTFCVPQWKIARLSPVVAIKNSAALSIFSPVSFWPGPSFSGWGNQEWSCQIKGHLQPELLAAGHPDAIPLSAPTAMPQGCSLSTPLSVLDIIWLSNFCQTDG